MSFWMVFYTQVLQNVRTDRLDLAKKGDLEASQKAIAGWTDRCRQFLKRPRQAQDEPASLPAPKVKRKKTFEWLLATDNQLRCVGLPGWQGLAVHPDPRQRGDPFSWPAPITICPDQGADCCAAINFLSRELHLNLDPTFCASHAAHNDVKNSLKRSGLWPHQLLMVLAWRAWRGPWGSDDRFQEVQDTCTANFETMTPATDPIFHLLQQGLLRDRGWEWRASEEDIDTTLWGELKGSRCFAYRGDEISMTRFMGSVMRSKQEDAEWHGRLYGLLAVCLELGILDSSSMDDLCNATAQVRNQHAEGCEADDARKATMKEATDREIKAIREAAKNSLHMSLLMYSDPINQNRQRMIALVTDPVLTFHQVSNATTRDVHGARKWLINMCEGGLMRPSIYLFAQTRISDNCC